MMVMVKKLHRWNCRGDSKWWGKYDEVVICDDREESEEKSQTIDKLKDELSDLNEQLEQVPPFLS